MKPVTASAIATGSGALPTEELPSVAIAVTHAHEGADWIAGRFRAASLPIIGRIQEDVFLLDMRTIADPRDIVPSRT